MRALRIRIFWAALVCVLAVLATPFLLAQQFPLPNLSVRGGGSPTYPLPTSPAPSYTPPSYAEPILPLPKEEPGYVQIPLSVHRAREADRLMAAIQIMKLSNEVARLQKENSELRQTIALLTPRPKVFP